MSHFDPPPIYDNNETWGMQRWFQRVHNLIHKIQDVFPLTDGVTEPSTIPGVAQIYVDIADGDLKIKYGDGVVKTIVLDT
jgi:hypothetical protein